MAWDITYHDEEPEKPQIGDMWPATDWAKSNMLSNEYLSLKGSRPPLMVLLPSAHSKDGDRFLVDRKVSDAEDGHGWKVTIKGGLKAGEKPNISVAPSINCVDSYHGFIRNGRITDDCDGKVYE